MKWDVNKIHVKMDINTEFNPVHWKTVASMTTYMVDRAVLEAAERQLKSIAAIFTIESVKDTPLNAGRIRLLGSFLGALVGVVFVYIQPNSAILSGLGMLPVIYVCHVFNLDNAVPIAGVVFMAIILGSNIKNPLQYSISRMINTGVGIIIAAAY